MALFLMRLLNEEDGTTAIEYAVIAFGIAVAVVAAVNTLGTTVLTTKFQAVNNAMNL